MPIPTTRTSFAWDQELKGFGLRVTVGGARSFVVDFISPDGRPRRMTLGRYPALSVAAGRKMAIDVKARAYRGEDALSSRKAKRAAAPDGAQPKTVGDLGERYLREYVAARRTKAGIQNEQSYWRSIAAGLGQALPLQAVTREAVDGLHLQLSRKTPIQANRVITSLKTAINQAVRWGWVPDNVAGGSRRNPESSRERYLTDAEVERLQAAIDGHPDKVGGLAVRLLLLTGARRGELLRSKWADVDPVAGIWTKPAATTKTKLVHRVVLSSAALELLRELRALSGSSSYLFPGQGNGPRADLKRTWSAIRSAAGLPTFRLHDLRHSHASFIARSGGSLLVIGRALGHTQAATTQRYAHLTDQSLRLAAESVAALAGGQSARPRDKE